LYSERNHIAGRRIWFLALVMAWTGLVRVCWAAPLYCDICGKVIDRTYYKFEDKAAGGAKIVCPDCEKLEARCFLCGLPVLENVVTLKDGRVMCARDYKAALHGDEEAKQACDETRDELNRKFSRFMTYPSQNVTVTIVDRFTLEGLFKTTEGFGHCVSVYGATQTREEGKGFAHSIDILSDLPKARLEAVCAHEYTHTWINENVGKLRRAVLAQEAVEGFCEFMAYKLMEAHSEAFEMETIRKNDYTRGQIAAFIEAEKVYGFNEILDWMKAGEDGKLDIDHLERIRAQSQTFAASGAQETSQASLLVVPVAAPEPERKSLVLQGISGKGQRRFAIINDQTFALMEQGRVRLGETNVSIQCLDIRKNSVVIQTAGSAKRQELFLPAQ
jgi:hypothetical protein